MNNKILSLLGFASKSGNLSYGFSSCLEALERKKAKLIICAKSLSEKTKLIVCGADLSEKTKKEITFHAQKTGVEVLTLKTVDIFTLSNSIGHKCGVISVNETGFAKSLKEEILNDK